MCRSKCWLNFESVVVGLGVILVSSDQRKIDAVFVRPRGFVAAINVCWLVWVILGFVSCCSSLGLLFTFLASSFPWEAVKVGDSSVGMR
jgi:hypothetical protein